MVQNGTLVFPNPPNSWNQGVTDEAAWLNSAQSLQEAWPGRDKGEYQHNEAWGSHPKEVCCKTSICWKEDMHIPHRSSILDSGTPQYAERSIAEMPCDTHSDPGSGDPAQGMWRGKHQKWPWRWISSVPHWERGQSCNRTSRHRPPMGWIKKIPKRVQQCWGQGRGPVKASDRQRSPLFPSGGERHWQQPTFLPLAGSSPHTPC